MKNNKIVIIAAMQEEMDFLKSQVSNLKSIKHAHTELFSANYGEQEIILAQSKIGKVNAASITTELINAYNPKLIINIGTSGAINDQLKVGDIIIGEKMFYGDVDVQVFGYAFGQVPAMPEFYQGTINDQALKQNDSYEFNVLKGNICTTDSFIGANAAPQIVEKVALPIDVMEMEATAIAQVCFLNEQEFIIIRSVSDLIFNHQNADQFNKTIKIVSENAAKVCLGVIDAY